MEVIAPLTALIFGALLVEKLVERIKAAFPVVASHWTFLVALVLSLGLVYAVPTLRLLSVFFGADVNPVVDLIFSGLTVASGSGFIASLEGSLRSNSARNEAYVASLEGE